MNKYRGINRSKTRLHYHLILVTKYRKDALVGIEDSVKSALESSASKCDGLKVRAVGVDRNHIHVVLDAQPRWSPSQIVSRIKQLMTWSLWKSEKAHLRHFYKGNKNILWSDGYFCETVGAVQETALLDYVKNQGIHPTR